MKFRVWLSDVRWKVVRFLLHIRGNQFVDQVLQIQRAYDALGVFDDTHLRFSENLFLDEIKRAMISMRSAQKFEKFRNAHDLQVDLGSGPAAVRPGWINIDLSLSEGDIDIAFSNDSSTYINYDLRLGLPLPDSSCKFIYSSHFFEHLEYLDAVNLFEDCYRCLQDGGRLRLALPNYRPFLAAYVNTDYEYFRQLNRYQIGVPAGEETLADSLSRGVYESGEHKYIYDPEKCNKLLSKIGFGQIVESDFLDGIDLAVRRPHTFYVEAIK